ncbi:unnamed protein product [Parnassius apollo]|uniref:(apollo) hypothetical protein n=1 Tax=Parnassius apollo TaxID=110799 RepID=A0A8S3X906_PARAO|nr:unnamed protein product [Parnassius apollo]
MPTQKCNSKREKLKLPEVFNLQSDLISKMPSLRIDQSDLKCNRNGCDYYGNPQWQGYCSKCHREQLLRQRRADEHESDRRSQEFKIPSAVNEGMKRDFRVLFPYLPAQVDRDTRLFVHSFMLDVIKCSSMMAVDELSERVQRQYQRFMRHMDTSQHFANMESETKELLMDFVEKHAMTYLHQLPGVVFSPAGTDDERADRTMSERIQQLSWVGETHLECNLDRNDAKCRQLLYKAISELLGMDGCAAPGGKLARVRRCCRHVLALCGVPASADELLPCLIFTAAALSLCGVAREVEELREETARMRTQVRSLCDGADALEENARTFEEQIAKKVKDVLAKTPLEIKPRRELPQLGKFKNINTVPLIDLETPAEDTVPQEVPTPHPPLIPTNQMSQAENEQEVPVLNTTEVQSTDQHDILDFHVADKPSPSKSPHNLYEKWDLKQTNSMELLTPSPLGFTPFDSRSIDELNTPDDFGAENIAPGLSNINYDIDLSDFSGDNSLAEDAPKCEPKDPFSPEGIKKDTFDPFAPLPPRSDYCAVLETLDEFSLVDSKNEVSEAFEIVHRGQDPFSPVLTGETSRNPFSPTRKETASILDDNESPTSACLLPSPLQPQTSKPA